MSTIHQERPKLIGETVLVNYIADPSIGHGQFRLENHGAEVMVAIVKSAWLEIGGQDQPIADVTIFDLNQDQMIDPENFKIGAGKTVTFLIGFPRVSHEPCFGESSAVGLRLRVNGIELQAFSPIKFLRRIPFER